MNKNHIVIGVTIIICAIGFYCLLDGFVNPVPNAEDIDHNKPEMILGLFLMISGWFSFLLGMIYIKQS